MQIGIIGAGNMATALAVGWGAPVLVHDLFVPRAEAQVDAGVRAGMPADVAGELVAASIGGTAALLQARGMDTLAVCRMVTSPGGITARGLAALEHGGVRAAFDDAMQVVVTR